MRNEHFMYGANDLIAFHVSSTAMINKYEIHEKWCEIFYLVSGSGTYYVEGNAYELKPGCLLLIRAGEAHYIAADMGSIYERYCVHFSPELLNSVDPSYTLLLPFLNRASGTMNYYLPDALTSQNVQAAFDTMCERCRTDDTEYDIRLQICCQLPPLLKLIYDMYQKRSAQNPSIRSELANGIIKYINLHLTDPIRLSDIATAFHYSEALLNQEFHKVMGTSIWSYIVTKRLLLAKQRIENGEPMKQTAEECGWHDYSAFYRAYRKQFGSGPRNSTSHPE